MPNNEKTEQLIMSAWQCRACDVEGRSPGNASPRCWNCDGPVIVTARPVIQVEAS